MALKTSLKLSLLLSCSTLVGAPEQTTAFWEDQASCLNWFAPWSKAVQWEPPYAQWYLEGKLNACYNCLDRHLESQTRHKTALIWEGERGELRTFTYEELSLEVNRFSNALKGLGVQKGDHVAIYLPMIPEAYIAMLSCARLGAPHTVVFAGFSSDALKDRMIDADAKLLITADGSFRRGKVIPLKENADAAIALCPKVEQMVVVARTGHKVTMKEGQDHWYHELMQVASSDCPPEVMDAEDLLFILYTSGTTGKPKGIMHTTGGYMVGATSTTQRVFDPKPTDVYWATADIGWITGHTYMVYGPLANGMTQFVYEGAFDWPDKEQMWRFIDKYKVTTLYTSPTLIRTLMKWGDEAIKKWDLSSLRLLGTVGEPINPEAWQWFSTQVGKNQCPIVDTWWQTETGSIMIAPLGGIEKAKPGSAGRPLPGIEPAIIDQEGAPSDSGFLVLTSPWPSMLRGIYKDPKRYEESYWKQGEDSAYYFTGDGAHCDEEGCYWIHGRIDDVINVSGHRLSSIEIENALVEFPIVAEAAAIAVAHEIKGQDVVCFIVLKEGMLLDLHQLEERLMQHLVKKIGAFARPQKILVLADLPKTRSGKIMRRLLRDIAEGRVIGDTTTLTDPSVLEEIKKEYVYS